MDTKRSGSLTSPNRALMCDRLDVALAQAHRYHHIVAALFNGLDRFKAVNDTLGHAAADAVLQRAAEQLTHCTREGATVARLGGDEFMIVPPNLSSPQGAATVAEKVLQELAQQMPFWPPERMDLVRGFPNPTLGKRNGGPKPTPCQIRTVSAE